MALIDCRTVTNQAWTSFYPLAISWTAGGRELVAVRPDGRSAVYTSMEGGAQHTVDYRLLCFPGPFDPRS